MSSTAPLKVRERRRLAPLARLVTTVVLLAVLLWRIDISRFAEALWFADLTILLTAFVLNSTAVLLSTWKWDVLLRCLGLRASRLVLVQHYMIGFFASSLLPGVVGGDVLRWHMTGELTGNRMKVAASILLERFIGVVGLVLLSLLLALFLTPELGVPPVRGFIALAVGGLIVGWWVAKERRLAGPVAFRLRRTAFRRPAKLLYRLHRTLRDVTPGALMIALGYSVLFYLATGFVFFLVCRSLGIPVSYWQATTVQALVALVTLVPISVGGLGVGQVADVFLLGLLGVEAHLALGASIARLALNYGYSLVGGVLFATSKRRGDGVAPPPRERPGDQRSRRTATSGFGSRIPAGERGTSEGN